MTLLEMLVKRANIYKNTMRLIEEHEKQYHEFTKEWVNGPEIGARSE